MHLRLPYQLLPRAHAALILLAALSLRGGAPAPEPTRYLAFQLFTGGVPGDPADVARLRSLDDLRSSVVDLRDRIGARGTEGRKLGVVLGPIAFDHTDDEARRMIAGTFDIALATGVAVGFHIDDQMFWGRRLSALRSARNIEWLDWKGTPNTGRRLDWSSTPLKIAPQLCLNSRDVRAAVALRAALIGQEVAKGIARLHAAHRDDLFIGVIAGWETQIGRDFDTGKYLGYCALTNAGYSAARPPPDLDSARIRIVADFVSLWAQSLTDAGVPRGKVFSHVAFMSEPMYKLAERVAPSRLTGPYLQLVNFSPPSAAFCSTCMPGLSTYPQPGLLDQWQGEREKHGNPSWASAEGTSLDPGSVEHGGAAMDMERYLGNMFNHGAVLVNVFGWGVGDAQNPFRRIAESESAIAAYRKFLRGEQMAEAPWPAPQIPPAGLEAKVHRVQAELPKWVEKHGPARVQDAASRLDRAMRSEHFEEASEAADAVLRTIEPFASEEVRSAGRRPRYLEWWMARLHGAAVFSVQVTQSRIPRRREVVMPGMRRRTESGSTPERAERRKQFELEALQYLDALYAFALKLTHELADAEDLVSDAMLLAFERWEQYQPGTKLRAWLFTILYHRFVSGKRGGRAREVDIPRDAEGHPLYELVGDADPEQRFYDGFLDEGITRAIDALPRDFRIAVVMSDVHGMRYSEIARTLAVPEGTVKSRLFRGRQLLRGMLASYALETGHVSFRNCRTAEPELMAS